MLNSQNAGCTVYAIGKRDLYLGTESLTHSGSQVDTSTHAWLGWVCCTTHMAIRSCLSSSSVAWYTPSYWYGLRELVLCHGWLHFLYLLCGTHSSTVLLLLISHLGYGLGLLNTYIWFHKGSIMYPLFRWKHVRNGTEQCVSGKPELWCSLVLSVSSNSCCGQCFSYIE